MQVIDRSGAQTGEYTDLSKVEKYEIAEDAYDKRTGIQVIARLRARLLCTSGEYLQLEEVDFKRWLIW